MDTTPLSLLAYETAAAKLLNELLEASTKRTLQRGQIADAMSTSREISCAQPPFLRGYDVPPDWLTFAKHGRVEFELAIDVLVRTQVVVAGRPIRLR